MTRSLRGVFSVCVGLACYASVASGQVLISQYYEGFSSDKWIELYNAGGGSVDLGAGDYRLGLWSNTNRQNWKVNGAPNNTLLLSGTVGPGSTFLIRNSSATNPVYAVSQQSNNTVMAFNGDDSLVLYLGATYNTTGIVDSIGLIATNLQDTSIERKSSISTGNTGTNDFAASDWDVFTLAAVDSASPGTPERLGFHALAISGPTHYVALNNLTPVAPYTNWATAATNIQDAIDVAGSGDTVLVSNGVYETGARVAGTNLLSNRVVIDKPIKLQSVNGPAVTIIKGAKDPITTNGNAAIRCAYVTNGASLSGFTLTNGATRAVAVANADELGGGVWSETGGVLSNCALTGNSAGYGGGGAYQGTLNNCVLTGNSAYDSGGGAYQGTLNNCTLTGNSSGSTGGGVYQGTVNNCIVYFNPSGGGEYSGGTINYTCTTPAPGGTGNITNDPQFANAGAGNFRLKSSSPCRDTGNNANAPGSTDLDGNPRIVNTNVDMGAYEFQIDTNPVHFVVLNNPTPAFPFATWATAATNIQNAIDAADAGDTVLVSNGVYETGARVTGTNLLNNRVVIDKSIKVQSVNGPAVTIIKGAKDPISLSNGNAAVRCVWMTNGASLVGFTLTNGATRALNGINAENIGGGVWSEIGGTLSNCVLTGNSAGSLGGGEYHGTLNNCTLSGNSAYYGGGAEGGTLNNCILTGNSAISSGGGAEGGTLNNCILTGNLAGDTAGGAYVSTLNNCTLTGNSASVGGGAEGGTLNNCIVYFNSAPIDSNHVACSFFYSCTTPLPAGAGNITSDPQFVNAGAGNYRLKSISPCRDTGTNSLVVGSTDLDGNPRIVNTNVDMGAYEFVPDTNPVHFVALNNPTPNFPFATWATAATNIQDAIDAADAGDTVLVTNGVYQTGGRVVGDALLTNRVVIDKPILVQSVNGPAVTIIKGAKDPITTNGNAAIRCAYVTNGASLVGFTLTNGATYAYFSGFARERGGGVWSETGGTLSNCVLTGNSAGDEGGGALQGTLNNCTLTGNSSGFSGGGALQGTLNNCTLTGNSAEFGGGAYFCTLNNCTLTGNSAGQGGGAKSATLNNCTLTGNSAGGGGGGGAYDCALNNCTLTGNSAVVDGGGAYAGTLNNCIVYFNSALITPNYFSGTFSYTCTTPDPGGTGNITNDPLFVSLATTNLTLAAGSPCRDIGNNANAPGATDLAGNPRIVNGSVDMGAYEIQTPPASAIHYVSLDSPNPQTPYAGWATAATNIQNAIDVAASNDTVLVTNGVYQTGGRIQPGFALTNRVVIDKPIPVLSVNGPASTTIKGAWQPGGTNGNAAVRCVWMTNGASLVGFTMTNGATRATDISNDPDNDGGGLWAQSNSVVVSNCIFTGNSAYDDGGGAYGGTVNNCNFIGNRADYGGGAGFYLNPGTLINCTLTGNSARNDGGGCAYDLTLNNCTLTGNSANHDAGGAYSATLNNCALTGNSAGNLGGGAYQGTLNNCTLTGNSAGGGSISGGGAYAVTLHNCIVFFNSPGGNHSSCGFTFSCTTPLPGGTGNITNDPLFVSLATTNLTLAVGSPCRDTGRNANAPSGPDLAGNPRIVNAVVDMGAYENQSVPSPDYDGDGMPNADETIAGSSAVNSNDVWKIASLTVTNPASISFATAIGSLYAVDRNDALVPNPQVWTEFTNNIPGTGGLITINDPLPGTNRNYRVRAKLQ